jgi:hypothetical protein
MWTVPYVGLFNGVETRVFQICPHQDAIFDLPISIVVVTAGTRT